MVAIRFVIFVVLASLSSMALAFNPAPRYQSGSEKIQSAKTAVDYFVDQLGRGIHVKNIFALGRMYDRISYQPLLDATQARLSELNDELFEMTGRLSDDGYTDTEFLASLNRIHMLTMAASNLEYERAMSGPEEDYGSSESVAYALDDISAIVNSAPDIRKRIQSVDIFGLESLPSGLEKLHKFVSTTKDADDTQDNTQLNLTKLISENVSRRVTALGTYSVLIPKQYIYLESLETGQLEKELDQIDVEFKIGADAVNIALDGKAIEELLPVIMTHMSDKTSADQLVFDTVEHFMSVGQGIGDSAKLRNQVAGRKGYASHRAWVESKRDDNPLIDDASVVAYESDVHGRLSAFANPGSKVNGDFSLYDAYQAKRRNRHLEHDKVFSAQKTIDRAIDEAKFFGLTFERVDASDNPKIHSRYIVSHTDNQTAQKTVVDIDVSGNIGPGAVVTYGLTPRDDKRVHISLNRSGADGDAITIGHVHGLTHELDHVVTYALAENKHFYANYTEDDSRLRETSFLGHDLEDPMVLTSLASMAMSRDSAKAYADQQQLTQLVSDGMSTQRAYLDRLLHSEIGNQGAKGFHIALEKTRERFGDFANWAAINYIARQHVTGDTTGEYSGAMDTYTMGHVLGAKIRPYIGDFIRNVSINLKEHPLKKLGSILKKGITKPVLNEIGQSWWGSIKKEVTLGRSNRHVVEQHPLYNVAAERLSPGNALQRYHGLEHFSGRAVK